MKLMHQQAWSKKAIWEPNLSSLLSYQGQIKHISNKLGLVASQNTQNQGTNSSGEQDMWN